MWKTNTDFLKTIFVASIGGGIVVFIQWLFKDKPLSIDKSGLGFEKLEENYESPYTDYSFYISNNNTHPVSLCRFDVLNQEKKSIQNVEFYFRNNNLSPTKITATCVIEPYHICALLVRFKNFSPDGKKTLIFHSNAIGYFYNRIGVLFSKLFCEKYLCHPIEFFKSSFLRMRKYSIKFS